MEFSDLGKQLGSPVQEINDPVLQGSGIRLLMKRDDLIHEHISGNKWRKLKYNLRVALDQEHHTLLTFGGAYSNHISATAFAAHKAGLSSIGVIRGEDDPTNPTLKFAREHGMQLHFVSRGDYREMTRVGACRGTALLDELEATYGRFFLIPEGGANGLGVRGCAEILPEVEEDFDVVCCAAGTGTTLAGLALTLKEGQRLIGFPALKGGGSLNGEVERLIGESGLRPLSTLAHQLITDYHFGGFAKLKPELLEFTNSFTERTGIPLDPIYTGKMMYGIYDMILKNAPLSHQGVTFPFLPKKEGRAERSEGRGMLRPGITILVIHTGGLQGWQGMQHRGLL